MIQLIRLNLSCSVKQVTTLAILQLRCRHLQILNTSQRAVNSLVRSILEQVCKTSISVSQICVCTYIMMVTCHNNNNILGAAPVNVTAVQSSAVPLPQWRSAGVLQLMKLSKQLVIVSFLAVDVSIMHQSTLMLLVSVLL